MSNFWHILNNPKTGEKSNTRFVCFVTIVLAALLIIACIVVMVVDAFKNGKIQIDYFEGISKIILAASAMIFSAGFPKSLSDKFQNINNMITRNYP